MCETFSQRACAWQGPLCQPDVRRCGALASSTAKTGSRTVKWTGSRIASKIVKWIGSRIVGKTAAPIVAAAADRFISLIKQKRRQDYLPGAVFVHPPCPNYRCRAPWASCFSRAIWREARF